MGKKELGHPHKPKAVSASFLALATSVMHLFLHYSLIQSSIPALTTPTGRHPSQLRIKKWEMGNGECEMGNGKKEMGNWKWEIASMSF